MVGYGRVWSGLLGDAVEIGSNGGLLSLQISEDFFKRSSARLSTLRVGGFISYRLCRRPLEPLAEAESRNEMPKLR